MDGDETYRLKSDIYRLMRKLDNKDWDVRQDAMKKIVEIGEPAVPLLIDIWKEKWDARSDVTSALIAIGEPAVPYLIDALNDESPGVRWSTAEALGYIGDVRAVPALIDVLKDENSDVRRWAAHALGKIEDGRAVPALIDTLKDENSDVRGEAVHALENIGDPRAVHPLIDTLKDEVWDVRCNTAEALGYIGDVRAVPALINALKDKVWDVRYHAADALGELGDVRAVPALLDALKDDKSVVQGHAAEALEKIADKHPEYDWDIAIPALIDGGIASVLYEIGLDRIPKIEDRVLVLLILNETDEIVDIKHDAVPVLIDVLKDKNSGLQFEAVSALGKIADKGVDCSAAVIALIDVLKTYPSLCKEAAEALDKIGLDRIPEFKDKMLALLILGKTDEIVGIGETTVPALIDALKYKRTDVRYTAAKALREIGLDKIPEFKDKMLALLILGKTDEIIAVGKAAFPYLIDVLKDEDKDEYVRARAAKILGELGDSSCVPVLIDVLKDKQWAVPTEAIKALGKIGDARAVPALIDVLKDENGDVVLRLWRLAAEVLYKIGLDRIPKMEDRVFTLLILNKIDEIVDIKHDAVPALIDVLKHRNRMHGEAAEALGEIGNASAVPALLDTLNGENWAHVQDHVAKAIGNIVGKHPEYEWGEAVPVLIDALKYKSTDVRYTAAEALRGIGLDKIPEMKDKILALIILGKTDEIFFVHGDAAIPYLIDALEDETPFVRSRAIQIVGYIRDRSAVPALIDGLKDDNEHVRKYAAKALGMIEDSSAFLPLMDALKDEEPDVQNAAVNAISNVAKKGEYVLVLKTIKNSTKIIMEEYRGEKDRYLLKERREKLAKFESLARKLHDKMNSVDKDKKFPVKHQPVKTVRRKVIHNG